MKNYFGKYILPLLSLAKKDKYFYFLAFVQIFETFYSIFSAFIVSQIIFAIETKNMEVLYFWIYGFVGVTGFSLIIKVYYDAIFTQFHRSIEKGGFYIYFQKFLHLDHAEVEKYGTGKMNHILHMGISVMPSLLVSLISLFSVVLSIIYAFVLIFQKISNIYYFIGIIVFFAIIIGIFLISLRQIFVIRKDTKKYFTEIDAKKVKILMNKFEIFQNNKIYTEIDQIMDIYAKEEKMAWKGHINKGCYFALVEAIFAGFQVVIFVIIGGGIISGNYEMATFALLIWLVQIITSNAWQLRSDVSAIMMNFVHWEKLVDIFVEIPEMKNTSNFPYFEYKMGKIEFQNITFSYEKNKNIFQNFSLKLEGGKKYALVGESGGGKTTILKLLSVYIRPDSGKICIDDQDLEAIHLASFYKNIGYLSQDPSVFDGTIYENIIYSLEYIPTDAEIKNMGLPQLSIKFS